MTVVMTMTEAAMHSNDYLLHTRSSTGRRFTLRECYPVVGVDSYPATPPGHVTGS